MSNAAILLERFDLAADAVDASNPAPEPETPDPTPAPEPPVAPAPAESLARIAAALDDAKAEMAAATQRAEARAAEGIAAAAAAMLPHLAETGFPAELAAATISLAAALPAAGLTLRCAREDHDLLSAALHGEPAWPPGDDGVDPRVGDTAPFGGPSFPRTPRPGSAPAAVDLLPDPELPPGAARVEWADGGADIDMAALTQAGLATLRRHLTPQPEEI